MSTQTFLEGIIDKFAELVIEKVKSQLDMSKYDNTIGNLPQILENMSDRQQRLEDKLDQQRTGDYTSEAFSDRIIEILQESSVIDDKIESALEDYDPADHLSNDDMASSILESYTFQDGLKDTIRDMTFTVEVR